MQIEIKEENPAVADVHSLLLEHVADMRMHSPPESVHALDMVALQVPAITFWTAREGGVLLGCGALKELDSESAEIKSMKTVSGHKRKGVAGRLLRHILSVAAERKLKCVLLETGTPQAFLPARRLYETHGFVECEPFSDYKHDPYSLFMRREIVT